jgi:exonuclease V
VLNIDQHMPFSTLFLDAMTLLCESNGLIEQTVECRCLAHVVEAWMSTLLSFNVHRFIVDNQLLVVYRKRRVRGKKDDKLQISEDAVSPEGSDVSSTERSLEPDKAISPVKNTTSDHGNTPQSVLGHSVVLGSVSLASQHLVIGSVDFEFDPVILNHHLSNVLDWWDGRRPPIGVSVEDIGRCR